MSLFYTGTTEREKESETEREREREREHITLLIRTVEHLVKYERCNIDFVTQRFFHLSIYVSIYRNNQMQ